MSERYPTEFNLLASDHADAKNATGNYSRMPVQRSIQYLN